MAKRVLMTGNEALGEGAIRGGCDCYFGYPITPQNELTAYMATYMPQRDRVFVQSESEVAAINMVYGAAATGMRAMTSSSSPGVSLKQEGISYLAGANLPGVIVNVMRAGPGLGDITPSQADYFQATLGGGHGDYNTLVLAPATVQEMHDFAIKAFDLADKYRGPVVILADGRLGQMMEPLVLRDEVTERPEKDWALDGAANGRPKRTIRSYYSGGRVEDNNIALQAKYKQMKAEEVMFETHLIEDAEIVVVAYGTSARLAAGAIDVVRAEGVNAGLIRPQTLFPFPTQAIRDHLNHAKCTLTVEMSAGQMIEDVRLAVEGQVPCHFFGRAGGAVSTVADIVDELRKLN